MKIAKIIDNVSASVLYVLAGTTAGQLAFTNGEGWKVPLAITILLISFRTCLLKSIKQ